MKYTDKNVVLSHVVNSDARSHWNLTDVSSVEILLYDRDEAHYTLHKTCIVYTSFYFCSFIM